MLRVIQLVWRCLLPLFPVFAFLYIMVFEEGLDKESTDSTVKDGIYAALLWVRNWNASVQSETIPQDNP